MLSKTIEDAMRRDRLLTDRVASKTLMRFPPPADDGSAPYEIDLSVPQLVWSKRGKRLFGKREVLMRGPVQVIGSYSELSGTFMWGYANDTVQSVAHASIAASIWNLPELVDLRDKAAFAVQDDRAAFHFACWVAARSGWLGALPFPTEAGTVYFALKAGPPDTSIEPSDNLWCTCCGRSPKDVRLWEFERGFSICAACVDLVREIAEEYEDADDGDVPLATSPDSDFGPTCIVCGSKCGHMVGFDMAHIGMRCWRKADAALHAKR